MTAYPHRLHPLARLSLFACFALAAAVVTLAAQPPEVEDPKAKPTKKVAVEDEDPKASVKKKVVVDDPEPKTKLPVGGSAPNVKLDELAIAADAAAHPALKAVYARYIVPFDRLTPNAGKASRMRPIPIFWKDATFPKQFGVIELDSNNQDQPTKNVSKSEVRKIDYFEELVIAETDALLKPAGGVDGPTVDDQLVAAEKLALAALRFHDYARENDKRQGKVWDDVRRPLVARVQEIRLLQFRRAVVGKDWARVRVFGNTLLTAYPAEPKIVQEVAEARVAEAEILMRSKSYIDQVRAREALDEVETRFPGTGGESARKIRKELAAEAARLYENAIAQKKVGHLVDARNDLNRAESLDPTIPGLRELKRELGTGSAVLYVGVRNFPERMSPATARLDSELQAVELLFEGLLQEVPDGTGGTRYRPGAAQTLPAIIPGGREFLIRQSPRQPNQEGFDANDVVETVKLLRSRADIWPAAGLPWFDDLPAPVGGGGLRIAFRHGHPDPRSLLTFKLLPAHWLTGQGKKIDDPEFATKPFGTGPYRIHSFPDPGAPGPRELVFADNPAFAGKWKDRVGQPHMREIRFVDLSQVADPVDLFRKGRLHILPDVTPTEMSQILSPGGVAEPGSGKGLIATASTNRRVHILAVNHRREPLQNKDLRKGLSQAIDREGILHELFGPARPEQRRFLAPMSGPFPPDSWATVKGPAGQAIPLLNRGEGQFRLRKYLATPGAILELRLSFASDPQTKSVCERIKTQIESLFQDTADGKKLTIKLDPQTPRDLLRLVESEHLYDLAYLPFDYPDDWYPYGLAAFLDHTAAERDGRNITGFLSPGANPDQDDRILDGELAGVLEHGDFTKDIAPRAARIHNAFNDSVPFIPLWQLDRQMLVYGGLKVFVDDTDEPASPHLLNQTVLFHNVARWRLE